MKTHQKFHIFQACIIWITQLNNWINLQIKSNLRKRPLVPMLSEPQRHTTLEAQTKTIMTDLAGSKK